MAWWQLSLIGVGCTIGTGYFLGSTIGIQLTGPSIVFSFLFAAIGTYIVFELLAKMTAADPQKGSFCYYASQAFGRWAGFSCGWNYWVSSILIMGSQLTALSILSQFWFPDIPLWVFAAGYAILAIIVVLAGTEKFDQIENFLAVIKVAAIVMFIILAIAGLVGLVDGRSYNLSIPQTNDGYFSGGLKGFWSSLIYAFYAFGGIEVIGMMAMQLRKTEDAAKAGTIMLLILTIIYVLSIGLAVTTVELEVFNHKESPFVTAMERYHLSFFPHVFNGAIIVAGFSAMAAALFGVTNLLQSLAEDGDAPKLFAKKIKFKELPLPAMGLGAAGLLASIITALLLPGRIYEYITTAAGILLLFNWLFIIFSAIKILQQKAMAKVIAGIAMLLIFAAVTGTWFEHTIRPGLYVSLVIAAIIGAVAIIIQRKHVKSQ
ncbi:amino acid permease [Fictibacillus phosphorivorans]|uniref:amino acid permease n=1 Tax=Fictibacillus phosphorivorans TaxID=1221500 RepID=UPI00203AB1B2|nr:amino acid permease [Fictibacillus phosphorivorans]MCM3720237.1 amino acid permease [Fictibacillus phosphorivorans]MCM3777918.1 amino acid permease [Fictibacillus phosphorivorans]